MITEFDCLIKELGKGNAKIRRGAKDALVKRGAPTVDALIKAYDSINMFVRIGAAEAIVKMGTPAVEAIRLIGDPAVETLVRALGSKHDEVRSSAAYVLGDLRDARAVDGLCKLLSDSNESVRQSASDSLVIIGAPAVETLIKSLQAMDMDGQASVSTILRKMDDQNAIRHRVLTTAEMTVQARASALIALYSHKGHHSTGRDGARKYCATMAKSSDSTVRIAANEMLEFFAMCDTLVQASHSSGGDLLRATKGKDLSISGEYLVQGTVAPTSLAPITRNLLQRLRGGKRESTGE